MAKMVGKAARYALVVPLVCACSSSEGVSTRGERAEFHRAMLGSIGMYVIAPTTREFAESAAALQEAAATYASSVAGQDLEAARASWKSAMASWQALEVMQVGPAAAMGDSPGGRDLRDEIYSWPLTSRCRIDQETLAESYGDPASFSALTINARGLDALEYLLFNPTTDNACAVDLSINTPGAWDSLGEGEVRRRRALYVQAAATDVLEHAEDLASAWAPNAGNFSAELSAAGVSSATYGSAQDALNAMAAALFYIEHKTKDEKVGKPAGIIDCATAPCLEALESPLSQVSLQNAVQNARAFAELFRGGDRLGFDDLLSEIGRADLSQRIEQAAAMTIEALEGLTPPLSAAIIDDPQSVAEAYDTLRALTILLKTEFITVLDLEMPDRGPADND